MFEGFIPNYSCLLHARDLEGNIIEIHFFSKYTPEQAIEKSKDYWTYDLIRFEPYRVYRRLFYLS